MPKYEIEFKEVKEGSGCGTIIAVFIIIFIVAAIAGR